MIRIFVLPLTIEGEIQYFIQKQINCWKPSKLQSSEEFDNEWLHLITCRVNEITSRRNETDENLNINDNNTEDEFLKTNGCMKWLNCKRI